jgi:hypothetical protein
MRNIQGGESLRFHKIHEQDPFRREVNYSRPSDLGELHGGWHKVFWHFVVQKFGSVVRGESRNHEVTEEYQPLAAEKARGSGLGGP